MGEKPVTDLAGVGETLGKRLEAAGFDKVWHFINSNSQQSWMRILVANEANKNGKLRHYLIFLYETSLFDTVRSRLALMFVAVYSDEEW